MIDRSAEVEWLRSHLEWDERQLLICYGRRRVGKTTLVTEVLDQLESPSIYYLCDERGTEANGRQFARRAADQFGDVPPAVDGFETAFEYLARRVDDQFVVALDEFTYLVEEDETIPSFFQTIVDEVLGETEISIVLLGSSISMMEEGVLSYESPLYGRRTGQWHLEPLTFGDAAGFFPEYDADELVRMYSVLGGIPAYLEQFDPALDLLANVEENVLSRGAFLYEEPEFLLRQELRDPATYRAILEAIAGGATRVTEIANEIGLQASGISRYLQNLRRIALVEREAPVTDPDGRGVYRITDHFLQFWFRYVPPNRSTLEQGNTAPVRASIEETFPGHVGWTFEDVCRQVARSPAFPIPCSRVGRWWYGEEEVDVVGVHEETDTLFLGECKWTNSPIGTSLLDDLETLEPQVRWHGDERSVRYGLFSKSGFESTLQKRATDRTDLFLYTPADLLSMVGR